MNFFCCGVKYSTNDPQTYFNIEKYRTKKVLKKFVGNKKVQHEEIYFIHCKKNDCIKTYIRRYSTPASTRQSLIEEEIINKKKTSLQFKSEQLKNLDYVSITAPVYRLAPQSKTVPFVYGKVEGSTTQRRRYLNETGYADYNCLSMPINIYKTESMKLNKKLLNLDCEKGKERLE